MGVKGLASFKQKFKVLDKKEYFCTDCLDFHYGLLFCAGNRHIQVDRMPESVWKDFEVGEDYWLEFRKVENGGD